MYSDFNAIEFVALLPINSISLLDGEKSIRLTTPEVNKVTRVLINGQDAGKFVITSPTTVVVDIPVSELNSVLESATLVGSSGEFSTVSFTAKSPQFMTDYSYSLQRFFRFLLMDPGSDIFNPTVGGGFVSLAGSTVLEDIALIATQRIRDVAKHVIETQSPTLAASKTITSVEITNINYSMRLSTLDVELSFSVLDGNSVVTGFSVSGYING